MHQPDLLLPPQRSRRRRSPAGSSTTARSSRPRYQGSYFFADYTQNWIRRLTFDASGNVTGVFNFEPADGSVDGPYGDIVYLTEGPDGALYYVDLGYSDISGTFGVSKIRRIRFVQSNQPPVAAAAANPTSGRRRWRSSFSSAGSIDPEGQPLTYSWTFGDGATSTAANPTHTYTQAGPVHGTAAGLRRRQHDDLAAASRSAPATRRRRRSCRPRTAATFRAGDVISFSGDATDPEDGTLPASAFTWNIDFLHEGHVAPGHADDRRQERDVHHPDDRSRLQRQHALPDHAHGDRLRPV